MRYVHSLWSTPARKKNFDNKYDEKYLSKNFYTYLLSALSIKKLGYQIDLYCDEYAYDMYSLIPYDNIHIVNYDRDGIDSKFWVWGKIKTYSLQEEPFIHIDGDVFFFKDIIGDKMSSGKYPLVVQNVENEKIMGECFVRDYLGSKHPFVNNNLCGIEWEKYGFTAYNCGVVGFNDLVFRNDYVNKVHEILTTLSKSGDFEENRRKYDSMFLLSEQSLLYYMTQERNIMPLEIIPEAEIIKRNYNWYPIASEIGYVHMWSYSKYKPEVIEKIKYRIERDFPEHAHLLNEFERKSNKIMA